MQVTLYVGGIESKLDDNQLRALFGEFGPVSETRVVLADDGSSRGFAYVTFADDLAAAKARMALDGKQLEGCTLRVALAK
jgi:RNA recognition motif-containing protein